MSQNTSDFLSELKATIEQNLSDEQFGVSELADQMSMSRSNLLRRVKKETNLSVSQLISQARLTKAMQLLRNSSMNVSEVSHAVGFNSTSYFIKCFREYYGYPPGEANKRNDGLDASPVNTPTSQLSPVKNWRIAVWTTAAFAFLALLTIGYKLFRPAEENPEKSIIVLPFKNESSDSSNVYIINGLMDATLSNLQKIGELKVLSRTTAEKYRDTKKSVTEMANELNVNYFIEGSGQKIGDQILLNIQLIDGRSDKRMWGKQYRRQAKDIFELQQEIAKNIAEEIEVVITPDERKLLEKNPTENLEAYDKYLKGRELIYRSEDTDLQAGATLMNEAITLDPNFALAYANAVIAYYYIDMFQADKRYLDKIGEYADKAMLLDPKTAETLVAKGLHYMHQGAYNQAVPYFEKALELNPGSGLVLHFLTEYYNIHNPNATKYLRYAIMGIRYEESKADSATKSFRYLQLANALVQNGFFDEAEAAIKKCLALNPNNPFGYASIFIEYAQTNDLRRTKTLLIEELKKDSMRFDVVQQIANISLVMEDYQEAFKYYSWSVRIRKSMQLDLLHNEDLNVALAFKKVGLEKEAPPFVASFKAYADNDKTIYKHAHLGLYEAYMGNDKAAIRHFRQFSTQDNYQYWALLLPREPILEGLRNHTEFKKIMNALEQKFWSNHERLKEEVATIAL